MALGADVRGSTRWIDFGFFRFQPSEFSCFWPCSSPASSPTGPPGRRVAHDGGRRRACRDSDPARFRAAGHWHGARLRLDPGGRALLRVHALARSGRPRVDRGSSSGRPCSPAPTLGVPILEQYQRDRITAFDPTENPQGAAYNINQSITAVGAGGLDRPRRRGSNPDEPRLPARAPHRLRLRLACRAARVRRGLDPAPALSAAALARDPRDRDRARSLLRDGRRGDRLRPPVPDLRQRRDDDRDRSDHGDSAPVRQRRRLPMVTNLLAIGVLQAIARRR